MLKASTVKRIESSSLYHKVLLLLPLVIVAFPGAYNVLIAFVASETLSIEQANLFSYGLFWVGFLASLTTGPVVAMLLDSRNYLSARVAGCLLLFASIIAVALALVYRLHQYPLALAGAVLFSVLLTGIHEIVKRILLNGAKFFSLTVATLLSIVILSMGLLVGVSHANGLLCLMAASLMLATALVAYIERDSNEVVDFFSPKPNKLISVMSPFMEFLGANLMSTSVMFLLPIILVHNLGDVKANEMAKVFYLSTMAYLMPRALSARYIPSLRTGRQFDSIVQRFFNYVLLFAFCSTVLACGLLVFVIEDWLLYGLLFVAMVSSQLSLPFANALTVMGKGRVILQVNTLAFICLALAVTLVYVVVPQGEIRALAIVAAFTGFQFIKLLLNSRRYKRELPAERFVIGEDYDKA